MRAVLMTPLSSSFGTSRKEGVYPQLLADVGVNKSEASKIVVSSFAIGKHASVQRQKSGEGGRVIDQR